MGGEVVHRVVGMGREGWEGCQSPTVPRHAATHPHELRVRDRGAREGERKRRGGVEGLLREWGAGGRGNGGGDCLWPPVPWLCHPSACAGGARAGPPTGVKPYKPLRLASALTRIKRKEDSLQPRIKPLLRSQPFPRRSRRRSPSRLGPGTLRRRASSFASLCCTGGTASSPFPSARSSRSSSASASRRRAGPRCDTVFTALLDARVS
jgi:hypothetical protein